MNDDKEENALMEKETIKKDFVISSTQSVNSSDINIQGVLLLKTHW